MKCLKEKEKVTINPKMESIELKCLVLISKRFKEKKKFADYSIKKTLDKEELEEIFYK